VPHVKGAASRQITEHRSYPKARLNAGVTANDLIPDDLWEKIGSLIPPVPERKRGPHFSMTQREMCAWFAARYIIGVPWQQVPASKHTVERNHALWTENGTWPRVRDIITGHGHLGQLAA
jgi:transposase